MNCDEYADSIDELVDGTIDDERRAALERHASECEACARLAEDLRQIRFAASRLPVHQPPGRIWEKLATQLPLADTGKAKASPYDRADGGFWSRLSVLWQPRLRFAYGALGAAAVAVVLLVTLMPSLRQQQPAPQQQATAARPVTPTPASTEAVHGSGDKTVQSVEMELQMAEQHYQNAISGLEKLAKAGEGTLDPQVAQTLKTNVAVIDKAIRESQVALKSQPTSQLAQESLFDAFRRKVALLEDTISLVNEMRKGNQAGAAKAIGNMNKSL